MPHVCFIAGVVTGIVPDPEKGPGGIARGPLERASGPKLLVCLDVVSGEVDPSAPRLTVNGEDTVEYRSPPPYHVIFRGEWAESLSCGELGVGDILGALFTYVPWDPVTLAEMARSSRAADIPILGEGERPQIFLKAENRPASALSGGETSGSSNTVGRPRSSGTSQASRIPETSGGSRALGCPRSSGTSEASRIPETSGGSRALGCPRSSGTSAASRIPETSGGSGVSGRRDAFGGSGVCGRRDA
ncbi:MAG: hypothetical protein LBQ79_05270, partial [Deltaproteobacteria bacterium]|nr:hypothetical protein [Deltaproteobacteria bacterium]